jgi:hypothetical protein
MTKILRTISVAATISAGLLLVAVASPGPLSRLGAQEDEQIGRLLNGPGAVDRFRHHHNGKHQDRQDATPALIEQARIFAKIINPPAPKQPPGQKGTDDRPPPPPEPPEFRLVGTSCSSNPDDSFAYVRLPNEPDQWVRQGAQVGHVVIKEIRHGSITYWDGRQHVETIVEPVPQTAGRLEPGTGATTRPQPYTSQS